MSDGVTHHNWWLALLPFSLIASVLLMFISPVLGIFTLTGYLLGNFIEPDLDQIGLSSSEGRAMRQFGLIGVFWVMFWMPYAYSFPHRSPFTHWPYLGAAIRMVYLLAIPFFVAWWFGWLGWFRQFSEFEIGMVFLGAWNGLSWSDTVHFALDTKIFKKVKRFVDRFVGVFSRA